MKHLSTLVRTTWLIPALLLAGCGKPTVQDHMMKSMQLSVEADHVGALAEMSIAIEMQPGDANIYMLRAGIHESLGDLASAVADYEMTLQLNPALGPGLREQLDYLREQLGVSSNTLAATPDVGGVQLGNFTFCSSRPAGFMDYDAKSDATYKPGEKVWIYFDLSDLSHQPAASGKVENVYSEHMVLNAPGGTVLINKTIIDDRRTVDKSENPDQMFMRNEIPLPSDAADGVYKVGITVTDKISSRTTYVSASFTVRG